MAYEDPAQLADLLQRLTRRLRRSQAEQLSPLGLTPAQELALRWIARGDEPPRMTELADRLGIVPRSVTTVVDALEQAGLVRREVDARNRRAILLYLTEQGAAVRDELREARRHAAEDLFAPLGEADRETLAGLLAKLDTAGRPVRERESPSNDTPLYGNEILILVRSAAPMRRGDCRIKDPRVCSAATSVITKSNSA
jgi:DNA-binding MarR family transcriptional regulator